MSTKTLIGIADAFGCDEQIDPEFCVGNSHAVIVRDTSATTAVCYCGNTLYRVNDEDYRHDTNDQAACPPYRCRDCGLLHNVPLTPYVMTYTDADGFHRSHSIATRRNLHTLARYVVRRDVTNIEVRDNSGRDVTFEVPAFAA